MSTVLSQGESTIKQVFKNYQLFWNSVAKTVVVYTKTVPPEAFTVSKEDALTGLGSESIRDQLLYSEVLYLYDEML